jgi:hypothetical protein
MRASGSYVSQLTAVAHWALLAVIVLAASVKSYSGYSATPDHPELTPRNILSGNARAPNRYRLLAPLVWRMAASAGIESDTAEKGVVFASIVFCYIALSTALYVSSRSVPVTAMCLLVFFGASASGFKWRYRDTFFDVGFACSGMVLVVRERPTWWLYCALSALAALNRETWVFSLCAAALSRWAHAGSLQGLFVQRRADVVGLLSAGLAAAIVFAGLRFHYGNAPYHMELWRYPTNLMHLFVGGSVRFVAAHGLWSAGSGMFALWLIFAMKGLCRHVPYSLGFLGSLLATSFLISNWSETRIFFAAYAVLLISASSGLVDKSTCSTPESAATQSESALVPILQL